METTKKDKKQIFDLNELQDAAGSYISFILPDEYWESWSDYKQENRKENDFFDVRYIEHDVYDFVLKDNLTLRQMIWAMMDIVDGKWRFFVYDPKEEEPFSMYVYDKSELRDYKKDLKWAKKDRIWVDLTQFGIDLKDYEFSGRERINKVINAINHTFDRLEYYDSETFIDYKNYVWFRKEGKDQYFEFKDELQNEDEDEQTFVAKKGLTWMKKLKFLHEYCDDYDGLYYIFNGYDPKNDFDQPFEIKEKIDLEDEDNKKIIDWKTLGINLPKILGRPIN